MSATGRHAYRLGLTGRSLTHRAGVGGTTFTAHVKCGSCPKLGDVKMGSILPPEVIDKKFLQASWRLDPHTCPDCIRVAAKTQAQKKVVMASKPAIKAQVAVFQMLSDHFDADAGSYSEGWNDVRVSKESGLALEMVTSFRREGFGDIKEPSELVKIRNDIAELEKFVNEFSASTAQSLAEIRSALGTASRQYAA